jgi:S1-C subfamily serine protease
MAILFVSGRLLLADDGTKPLSLRLDEIVMRSTFKIQSENSVGTAFIMFRPLTVRTNFSHPILITAAHVLVSMPSSNATIFFREKEGELYRKVSWQFPIRAHGTNLWMQHPKADVAAMLIRIPKTIAPSDLKGVTLSTDFLADEKFFADAVIHPGDELRVLGYPYALEANNMGFPILRSGRIASFPVGPSSNNPTFLLDFRIFPGNSGGPVYILDTQRQMEANKIGLVNAQAVVGLISEQATVSEQIRGLTETMMKTHEVGLGIVIHSQLIRETIALLPYPEPP